jgi:hypothetical protein
MAPRKHLAVSASTTRVVSPEHRGIGTALRCEAKTSAFVPKRKHPSPPSLWHKATASDKDADILLGRALQNEHATCPSVAERHTAVRSACWPPTPAAGEFAAAKRSRDRPLASAEARARPDTPGGAGPGPSRCAKANPKLYTRAVPGPGSASLSTCPTLSLRWRQACAHERILTRRNGGRHHFVPLYRPRSPSGRPSTRTKREQITRATTRQDTLHLKAGTIAATTISQASVTLGVFTAPRANWNGFLRLFPLDLSGRSVSGLIRVRKNQLQPDQQKDGHRSGHCSGITVTVLDCTSALSLSCNELSASTASVPQHVMTRDCPPAHGRSARRRPQTPLIALYSQGIHRVCRRLSSAVLARLPQ